jgi:steroid delta-isomerase-like uncharacterized protein
MSIEENKALARRWCEAFNTQNWAAIVAITAPDFVQHGAPPGIAADLAGHQQLMMAFWTAFPDAHQVNDELIAEGDKVVERYTVRGTHQGAFLGLPPTGKQVSVRALGIDRIKDGKIVETWISMDTLGLLQQLGALPQLAPAGAST